MDVISVISCHVYFDSDWHGIDPDAFGAMDVYEHNDIFAQILS